MARGGYRKPRDPAQRSGPGALSQRTDGKPGERFVPSGGPYGSRKALEEINAQAPAAASASGGGGQEAAPVGEPVDMFAMPTDFPDEPITAGVPIGPGAGPSEIVPDTDGDWLAAAARLMPTSALLRLLEWEGGGA